MFDGKSDEEKLKLASSLFKEACDADAKFQEEAQEDFDFRDGEQWTEEEKRILEEEMRPCLTFNLTKTQVDLVMGTNEDMAVQYLATPIEPSDGFLCDVLNDVAEWVQDKENFSGEESDAFESGVICGRGYAGLDFVPDPKRLGFIRILPVSIPVYELKKDPASRKDDMSDARYVFWDKWISIEDFKMQYPDYKGDIDELMDTGRYMPLSIEAPYSQSGVFEMERGFNEDTSDYERPLDYSFYDRTKRMLRIVHMEYWEAYKRYYGFNPVTGKQEEFQKEHLKKLKTVFPKVYDREFEWVEIMDKKIKWMQFTGHEIMYDGDASLPYDGYSMSPCFVFKDISKKSGDHFGLVRMLKDPQMEVNKRWSQTLNMLNNQVQPGVYAEVDAFVDTRQAAQSMKEPGSTTWLQSGAIAGKKFMERGLPNMPNAPIQLDQIAQEMMKRISGINPDLLGMDRGRQEPGVVVRLRQQQGLTLLKPIFKAYQRMKKGLFERLIAVITAYMPDEQIMMILGESDKYVIQNGVVIDQQTQRVAPLRDLRGLKYNVKASPAPGNKTQKMLELSTFLEMQQAGFPVDPMAVIDKLEISDNDKQRWMAFIKQQQESAAKAQEQQFQLEMMKIQAKQQADMTKVQADMGVKQEKIVAQREKDSAKHKVDQRRLEIENRKVDLDFLARQSATKVQGDKVPSERK